MTTPTPHPATNSTKHARLPVFLWRYFTGNHLDGRARTNASWFKRGTAPHHHVNWWSAKPRAHRALWRWFILLFPGGLMTAYAFAPTVQVNLIVLILLAVIPYLFHHGSQKLVRMFPTHRVVYVHDNVSADAVDQELDKIPGITEVIPGEMDNLRDLLDADITREFDESISKAEESADVPSKPRKTRSS